jgi:hypothetical protein
LAQAHIIQGHPAKAMVIVQVKAHGGGSGRRRHLAAALFPGCC